MAIDGKAWATCACYFMMIVSVLEMIIMFAVILNMMTAPSQRSENRFPKDDFLDQKELEELIILVGLIGIFLTLVVVSLRSFGTWKLWQSLQQCETKPEAALKSVLVCRNLEIGACAVCAFVSVISITLIFIILVIPDLMFLRYIQNYCNGLRKEIGRRRIEMMGMEAGGLPIGYGYGHPWPVIPSVMYPTAPYNVPGNDDAPFLP